MFFGDELNQQAAAEGNQRHAHGVAEHGGVQAALAFHAAPCAFEAAAFCRLDARVVVVFQIFQRGVAQVRELHADVGDVVQQALDAVGRDAVLAAVLRIVGERLVGGLGGAFQLGRDSVFGIFAQAFCKFAAGAGLQAQQAAQAENQVAVLHLLGKGLVMHVAGTDAFVNVLCGEIITQHFGGARMTVLAAHPVKQGATGVVECFDDARVAHGQRDLPLFQMFDFVGVEKFGFGFQIGGQCGVGIGHAVLHGAVRKEDVGEQGGTAIQQRAAQNQQAVHIQRRLRVVRERGIDGNGERAEGDGAEARSGGPQKGKHEGEQREGERYPDRVLEGELDRQRGDGEGDNGEAEIFEFAGQPVVQIHQATSDNAQK